MASMTSLFRGSPKSVAETALMILLPTRSPKARCTQLTKSANFLPCFLIGTSNVINHVYHILFSNLWLLNFSDWAIHPEIAGLAATPKQVSLP